MMLRRHKLIILSLSLTVLGLALLLIWQSSKVTALSTELELTQTPAYLPLYSRDPFPLPDSVQYVYNTINCRSQALSGGDFFVHLNYPVLRSESPSAQKMSQWILDQLYILMDNQPDYEFSPRDRFGHNLAAYANYVLNSWLTTQETTYMGCMQESLSITMEQNLPVMTLKVHHKGFWGGAHGDDISSYFMFNRDFEPITMEELVRPEKMAEFEGMLVSEYDRQITPWRDYGRDYKIHPRYLVLLPEGMKAVYEGYAHAEGNPEMLVLPEKYGRMLKGTED